MARRARVEFVGAVYHVRDRGSFALRLSADDLAALPKEDRQKVALASVIRQRTIVANDWIARNLLSK
jgi:hypothetical protein